MTPSTPLPENDPGAAPVGVPPLPTRSATEAAAEYGAPAAPPVDDADPGAEPRRPARTSKARSKRPTKKTERAAPRPPEIPAAVAAARFDSVPVLADGDLVDAPATDESLSEPVIPEAVTEPEPEREPEALSEPGPEPEAERKPKRKPKARAVPHPEVETAPEPEPEPVPVPEPELEPEPEPEPEPEDKPKPEPEAEPELKPQPEIDRTVPALRVRGVAKSFGAARAVDALDLEIPAGTFYGIVGPNGAGKTTTLSMIAGLLRPDSGTIEVAGLDLAADPRGAKRRMGILPDRLRTFDRLTGRQLLYYYGVLRGLRPAVVEARTADLARAFDLTEALGRPVSDYSTGMTKKIMLAGAMIHSPRVLVLDEPFESVDPVSSAVILDILSAYVDHGGTVILSSHGMDLVERVCSGVAVIVAGRVLAEGTVAEVRGTGTLEQRFLELIGGSADAEGLEWLHTFSD